MSRSLPDAQPLDARPRLQQSDLRQLGYYAGKLSGGLTYYQGEQPIGRLDLEMEWDEEPAAHDEEVDEDDEETTPARPLATGLLTLRYQGGTGSWVQLVSLRRRPSNLGRGGGIWYFLCPQTGDRCRTLYLGHQGFVSRQALPSARYRSQTLAKGERAFSRHLRQLEQLRNHQVEWGLRKGRKASYGGRITRPMRRLVLLAEGLKQSRW